MRRFGGRSGRDFSSQPAIRGSVPLQSATKSVNLPENNKLPAIDKANHRVIFFQKEKGVAVDWSLNHSKN
jgi:hypothetical protein